jgi:hypothetical protein
LERTDILQGFECQTTCLISTNNLNRLFKVA